MKLEYLFTDIKELSYKKDLHESTQIEIQTKMDYTVYYSNDETSCLGDFFIELFSTENIDQLHVQYHSTSVFNLHQTAINDEIKKEIHIESYNRLYPLCFAHVKNFLSLIGLPEIPIVPIDFSQAEIDINNQ